LGFCLVPVVAAVVDRFQFTERYAAARSDYYLRRAEAVHTDPEAQRLFAAAAVDVSPNNDSVLERAQSLGLPKAAAKSLASPSLRLGASETWNHAEGITAGEECPAPNGTERIKVFPTNLGFVHASEIGLKDWKATVDFFAKTSHDKFMKAYKARQKKSPEDSKFIHVNNRFFKTQITEPKAAMANPKSWKAMYTSPFYKEWSKKAVDICSSYLRKSGVALSEEEEANMETVLWAAVYPESDGDLISHFYHAHQESIVSFVLFVAMPEPTTPMTLADPRGALPIEDFEWFQALGDLGVDAAPPFQSTLEFFPGVGDIVIFPSWLIHKVPPHIGKGTRVAWPANCHLPKHFSNGHMENPLDGWQRTIQPPPPFTGLRASAANAYVEHARAVLRVGSKVDDPYMKMWEVQNQVVAMIQSAPTDASIWLAAGNVSWHLAYLLAARDEGDYFPDAIAMWSKALSLDVTLLDPLKASLKAFRVPTVKEPQAKPQPVAKKWTKQVLGWKGSPPQKEFLQFLVPSVNGPPGLCTKMCMPTGLPPLVPAVKILTPFSTFLLRGAMASYSSEETHLLQVAAAELKTTPRNLHWVAIPGGCWHLNKTASLAGVVCGSTPSKIWFADPRGAWSQHWDGSVSAGPDAFPRGAGCPGSGGLLASEPKAPFHRHHEEECKAGDFLMFPAWLSYQVAPAETAADVRHFSVDTEWTEGVGGWRVPIQKPLCKDFAVHDAQSLERTKPRAEEL